ncbi:hypothetical protein [Actinoplanes sp. DH11]|uniref:hypothetical protein n=1 Tax=Actinoplanes sp. DH11 TaxID=2857011 RepID=UPI001E4A8A3E|nr:hypothetical protein [Actinoplanes sp. DH11]
MSAPATGDSRPRRRLRAVAVVTVWVVALLALSLWSARRDPPTVAEQRDIGHAVPELRRATGALFAAADGERWALRLGELRIEECSINPAWAGRVATRDLTLIVPEGDARAALDAVAAGLPADYRASVIALRGGTRLSFYADAGSFIAIDAEANAADQVLTLRADSGCRPAAATDAADPPAGLAPGSLGETLEALGADPGTVSAAPGSPTPGSPAPGRPAPGSPVSGDSGAYAVACPGGGAGATFTADGGVAEDGDGPAGVPDDAELIWSDAGGWAYRTGVDSVVVTAQGGRYQVSVTTDCRAG